MDSKRDKCRRLFFALEPTLFVRKQLVVVRDQVAVANRGRAVTDSNLHLTLQFIGSCPAETVSELQLAADALRAKQFSLVLDRFGYWKRPRVLWLGSQITPVPLLALHAGLETVLKRELGIDLEPRSYTPHVTLMRKVGQVEELPNFPPLEWVVDSFSLMESISTQKGVHYHTISSWKLDGAGSKPVG